MDVDECIMAYIKLMKMISNKPSKWGLFSFFGKIEPQLDSNKLEGAINEVSKRYSVKRLKVRLSKSFLISKISGFRRYLP